MIGSNGTSEIHSFFFSIRIKNKKKLDIIFFLFLHLTVPHDRYKRSGCLTVLEVAIVLKVLLITIFDCACCHPYIHSSCGCTNSSLRRVLSHNLVNRYTVLRVKAHLKPCRSSTITACQRTRHRPVLSPRRRHRIMVLKHYCGRPRGQMH